MTPKPPTSLVGYLRDKRCVLFCGSGLSAWANLPTWTELLGDIVRRLPEELPDQADSEELDRLLQKGKLLEVADHCKDKLGGRYHEILTRRLRGDTGPIPEPHQVIVSLPFAGVITTNYDKLLERAYSIYSVNDGVPRTVTQDDDAMLSTLLFDQRFYILKAHGDIDDPRSMVLTTRDYQQIIHASPAFSSVFSAILLTNAVLFVGYSINDPDFRLLLDRQFAIFRGEVPARYALMSGVGRVERELLWRTARIKVLSYDDGDHEQVLHFLRDLRAQVAPPATAAVSEPATQPPGPAPREAQVPPATPAPPSPSRPPATARGVDGGATGVDVETPTHGTQEHAVLSASGQEAPTRLEIRIRSQKIHAKIVSGNTNLQAEGASIDWKAVRSIATDPSDDKLSTRAGEQLASWLPESIVTALAELDPASVVMLHLSPEVELLPWEWVRIGGACLVVRNPIVRAPVGVSDSARGRPMVSSPPRVLLIGDPNRDDTSTNLIKLPGANSETTTIAEVYRTRAKIEPLVLLGSDASVDRLEAELGATHFDVVHFAGHAWFDDLEPYLYLANETKLRASEVRSALSRRPPAIVFLNSHYSFLYAPGRDEQSPARCHHAQYLRSTRFHRRRLDGGRWRVDRHILRRARR